MKGTPKAGLLGATIGFFIGFAAVALFGPTAARFKDAMQLTPLMVGFLVAVPSLSGSLLRIPFSAWVDTTGGRKPFLILLGLSIVGMIGLSLVVLFLYPDRLSSSHYPLLLLLGALSGCGIATFSVGISQVSYWFPLEKQGSALGAYAGTGNLAPGIFSLILPVALSSLGLAGSYLVWLAFLTGGTILYYFLGRNSPYFQYRQHGAEPLKAKELARKDGQQIFPAAGLVQSLLISARVWKTWALLAIYFTTFGGFIALTAWLPTYWTAFLGVSTVTAGTLTAVYSITASLVRIYGGKIADKLGGENTAILALLLTLCGAGILVFSNSIPLSITGELLMAVGMGAGNGAVFKLVPQAVPQAVGGASGWVGGLGAFGGFAIPPILGAFVRSVGEAGYASGFGVFILIGLISLGLSFTLKRVRIAKSETRTA
ncbi:MAG: MFS transporter [Chloroflexi bacterium]|nr:MAG: MFS transporter [Chloroflexota bacterium]